MVTLTDIKDASPRWLKDVGDTLTRSYGRRTAAARPVPDFLIIGTKRGGTTSLFNYLLMHPGVLGLFPQLRGRKSTDYFFKEYHRGEGWYRSHFHTDSYRRLVARSAGHRPVSGEASPYYQWDPRIAERVRATAPDVRAIALLRDPVDRAWSHHQERAANGVEPLGFEAALAAEEDRLAGELDAMLEDPAYYSAAYDFYSYRSRGLYLPQIQNWHASFPEGQLLVLRSEDMYSDVQGTFDTVCDFLGLPRFALPSTKPFNAITRSQIPPNARKELEDFYFRPNQDLADYLGRPLLWT